MATVCNTDCEWRWTRQLNPDEPLYMAIAYGRWWDDDRKGWLAYESSGTWNRWGNYALTYTPSRALLDAVLRGGAWLKRPPWSAMEYWGFFTYDGTDNEF